MQSDSPEILTGPYRSLPPLTAVRSVFERILEITVIVLMCALALLVVVAVGFRKAGAALAWYDEIASVLLAWLTYYGACLAALKHEHLGFPQLVKVAPARLRVPLFVIRELCVVGFFASVAYAGFRVLAVLGGTTLVSLPWLSTQVTQSVIPIGAVLFILAELLGVPDRLAELRR